MEEQNSNTPENGEKKRKRAGFNAKPVVLIVIAVFILWTAWTVFGFFAAGTDDSQRRAKRPVTKSDRVTARENAAAKNDTVQPNKTQENRDNLTTAPGAQANGAEQAPPPPPPKSTKETRRNQPQNNVVPNQAPFQGGGSAAFSKKRGVSFVEAIIKPLDYELNERFNGWRANNLVRLGDDVMNHQLGILEVTRRTTLVLMESISRNSTNEAYVPALEHAMSWFMLKPTKYMFPSASSKYQEGIDELRNYLDMLKRNRANFYTRLNNLVPLLSTYESILGSTGENLVRDLGDIGMFKADNFFYHSRGIALAMSEVLLAVEEDFKETLMSAQGLELLQQATRSLQQASNIKPFIVLEGNPGGTFANHRANMAAPISNARFYIRVLITTLTGNL